MFRGPVDNPSAAAQAMVALLLPLSNHTGALVATGWQGRWQAGPVNGFGDTPIRELANGRWGWWLWAASVSR